MEADLLLVADPARPQLAALLRPRLLLQPHPGPALGLGLGRGLTGVAGTRLPRHSLYAELLHRFVGLCNCQNIAPSGFKLFVIFPFPLPQLPKRSHYWTAPSNISEVGVRAWHSLHWWLGLALRLVLVTILQRRTSTTGHLVASTPTKLDSSWSAPPLKVNIVFCFLMVTWSGPGRGHFSTLSVLHSGWSSSMSWYSMWKPHLVS